MKTTENNIDQYLSDDDLMALIEDTEAHFDLAAPPDLAENVIARIDAFESARANASRLKKAEYRRFCIRVGVAAAAAIAFMVMAPFVSVKLKSGNLYQTYSGNMLTGDKSSSREEVLGEMSIPDKNDVVDYNIPTKEEALKHDSITGSIRDSHVISNTYKKSDS